MRYLRSTSSASDPFAAPLAERCIGTTWRAKAKQWRQITRNFLFTHDIWAAEDGMPNELPNSLSIWEADGLLEVVAKGTPYALERGGRKHENAVSSVDDDNCCGCSI
jgi:hypothetical protein